MANEELIIRLNMLEKEAEEKRSQVEEIDRQIIEMNNLKSSLEKIEKSKNKEMLANLGRGIFLETKVNDDKVFVNVGSKTLVKKSFKEAVEIIEKQLSGLEEIRHDALHIVGEINAELYNLLEEAQKIENI